MNLDIFPIWLVYIGLLLLIVGSIECSYRYGKMLFDKGTKEPGDPIKLMVSASLSLLAFLIGFTFSIATARYDARRALVQSEANAIASSYLRASCIEEPFKSTAQNLLREYAKARTHGFESREQAETVARSSEKLQDQLWSETVVPTALKHVDSPIYALYMSSVSEVIDVHMKRVSAGIHSRVPQSVWLLMIVIAALSMSSLGFFCGLMGRRIHVETTLLSICFASAIALVVDIDRPWQGSFSVSQQPLIDLSARIDHGEQ